MNPLLSGLVVTLLAFLASGWWFGVLRRRKAETAAGVQALAGMKWRECAGLVLQALAEKGYVEAPSSRQPGDGGTEFLLSKGDERCLLGYKHGTAYRLGEANVRDFANAVQLQGATTGILVTLGSAEAFARDIAGRYGVELIDGRSLWPQVEPFAPPAMVEDIRLHAGSAIRHGQRLGIFASLGLGLLVYVAGTLLKSDDPVAVSPVAAALPAAATAPADPASLEVTAAMKALEEIANLTSEQRIQRRVLAASRVSDLEDANSAHWAAESTLVISLIDADGIDSGVVNKACAILVEYEELRYTRLQLEPPSGSTTPVRWRQCQ